MTTVLTIQKLNNTVFNDSLNNNAFENGKPRTIENNKLFTDLISTNTIELTVLQQGTINLLRSINYIVTTFNENHKTYQTAHIFIKIENDPQYYKINADKITIIYNTDIRTVNPIMVFKYNGELTHFVIKNTDLFSKKYIYNLSFQNIKIYLIF